jgi:hypothetical protein
VCFDFAQAQRSQQLAAETLVGFGEDTKRVTAWEDDYSLQPVMGAAHIPKTLRDGYTFTMTCVEDGDGEDDIAELGKGCLVNEKKSTKIFVAFSSKELGAWLNAGIDKLSVDVLTYHLGYW